MRQALQKQPTSDVRSIPAPVGGWNTKDELADMDPRDAPILDNLFPRNADVQLRKGFSNHTTGITGNVETLAQYAYGTTKKMFAAAGTAIYDASSSGAVGAAVVSGTANARWQHINFGTGAGQFLMLVNGADTPWNYNGTTWQQTPAITVATPTTLIHINQFKQRIFFVEKDTLNAWYLPVNAIGGAAAKLDFSSLTRLGGYLMAMGTWTIDGGVGIDDHAVWITSEGEVIIYKGTDPSSANTWSLVGIYRIGRPIGRRCMIKIGGDLIIVTVDGFVPLSKVLSAERNREAAISDKIYEAVNAAAVAYGSKYGWQPILYPNGNMLLFNIPLVEGGEAHQYVMNTKTGAWCRFKGWNAVCFELFNENLYFGTSGKVCKAWDTQADAGVIINSEGKQAFNYFGSKGVLKQFKMVRPIISTDGSIGVVLGVNVDYEDIAPTSSPTFAASTGATWDVSDWDTSDWGASLSIKKTWQTVNGLGYCGAVRLKAATNLPQMFWVSTDVMFERGGYL